jgi:hypothetical protein
LRTLLPPEHITVPTQPGQPALYTNPFFGELSKEEPIISPRATAVAPGCADQPLRLIRVAGGHFATKFGLTPGRWTFHIDAVTAGGQPLSGCFSQTIRS